MTTTTARPSFASTINPMGMGPGSNPNYHFNVEKANNACVRTKGRYISEEVECCVHCGKRLRPMAKMQFAFLADMGHYMAAADSHGDDLGLRPVGSECARTLSAAGVPLYTSAGKEI